MPVQHGRYVARRPAVEDEYIASVKTEGSFAGNPDYAMLSVACTLGGSLQLVRGDMDLTLMYRTSGHAMNDSATSRLPRVLLTISVSSSPSKRRKRSSRRASGKS